MPLPNQEQIELWNGRVGAKWSQLQTALDDMLGHSSAELATRAGAVQDLRVLDIGCGTGATCLTWLAGGAQVTGVDVSEPMLAVASQRCNGQARLIRADAAEWRSDQPFDLAVSHFGVMFFDAPESAFRNIAGNLRKHGRLLFICWRAQEENQWVTAPMQAVQDLLPKIDPDPDPDLHLDPIAANPHAPGPFALADRERLTTILHRAGFSDVQCQPFDFPVCVSKDGGVDAATRFLLQIGPTSVAVAMAGDAAKQAAPARLGAMLATHEQNGLVTLGGAAWVVDARV